MNRLFGTDGVRGRVGTELTADLAFRLGRACGGYFLERGIPRCALARDTRSSGEMLAAAFLGGAASVGVESIDLGIAPTPAVSVLLGLAAGGSTEVSDLRDAFGVVISASHNPYFDNGIKLFSSTGEKLSVPEEEAIERRVRTAAELDASDNSVGRIRRAPERIDTYLHSLRRRFGLESGSFRLTRTRLVIDAAHGAWAPHVQSLFAGLSPDIVFLNCDFTGTDINDRCGSTHLETLDPHLTENSVGLAFDGDGDRMLIRIFNPQSAIRNSQFTTVDGDALLYLFAKHLIRSGPVVGTVMSNGSLSAALEPLGREFLRAPVGDREVYEWMGANGSELGGEQSGHLIFRPIQRTGDGAATALSFLTVLAQNYGESIDALLRDLPAPFPQKLVNVRVAQKRPWESDPDLAAAVRQAEEKLGRHGRLVIRYSGTEPLLRLMAESPSAAAVNEQLEFLADRFRARLSGS